MFHKRHILLCILTVAAFISLTFVFVRARIRTAPATQSQRTASRPAKNPEGFVPKERIEMVQITVRPTGFEPSEIELSNKKFLLAIDNQSGAGSLAVQLFEEDERGNARAKLRDLGLSLELLNKREVTHLPPGRYVLREMNHPDWACHITIGRD